MKVVPVQKSFEWFLENAIRGRRAKNHAIAGTVCGIAKNLLPESETAFIDLSKKALNIAQGFFYGSSGYEQFRIYGRADDDLGDDYERSSSAVGFGEIACFIEKYIKPIVQPLIGFLKENKRDAIELLINAPNSLWWRARLINQGLLFKQLGTTLIKKFRNIFSQDISKAKVSVDDINYLISPLLAFLGLAGLAITRPIEVLKKWKGEEPAWYIRVFGQMPFMLQNIIYLFRFTLPELINSKLTGSRESMKLFYLGLATNLMSIGLPVVNGTPINNENLTRCRNIYNETATGFLFTFFSNRRQVLGEEQIEANLGEISDKTESLECLKV